jgi:hypothetical protein
VSGLNKREARLVKNRAAAFLSRQRKREEFELMEMWVILFFTAGFRHWQWHHFRSCSSLEKFFAE